MPSPAVSGATTVVTDGLQDSLIRIRWQIVVIKGPHHVQRSTLPRRTRDHVKKRHASVPQEGQELYHHNETVDAEKKQPQGVSSQDGQVFLCDKR